MTATGKRGPKSGVYNVDEAALMLAYLSRAARWQTIEPCSRDGQPRGFAGNCWRALRRLAAEIKARP